MKYTVYNSIYCMNLHMKLREKNLTPKIHLTGRLVHRFSPDLTPCDLSSVCKKSNVLHTTTR